MIKLLIFFWAIILSTQFTLHAQTQIGQDIDGEAAGDLSGSVLSINDDGSILAIGAIFNNGNGAFSGHVRVYQYDGANWIQRGQDIDGEASEDTSGRVSLNSDGSILAIGAGGNDGNGANSGHVRIYQYDGANWIQLGQDIDGETAFDNSGENIAINSDGSVVAIGAPSNAGFNSGHVRVYHYDGANWIQRGQDIDGEGVEDRSGSSVSINNDGSIVAIGATRNDGNGADSGHVRVYQYDGNNWIQLGQDIDGEAIDDFSGIVSLNSDGSIVAIGAGGNDGNGADSGHVRVYQYDGNNWIQRGQDIDGEAIGDLSGIVSLNSDGSIVAIGADRNDGNGTNSGHVRIYQYDGANWIQRGQDIDGEAINDLSGSVSLNSAGSVVAIGAFANDGNGPDSGHVRVYDLSAVLSVDQISNELNITLYPNPAHDYLNISDTESKFLLTVYDVAGKEVLTKEVIQKVDVSAFPSGTYILKISNGNNASTYKLIKNN